MKPRIPIFEEEEGKYIIRLFLELNENGDVLFTNSLHKKIEIPTELFGPTHTRIKEFEKEHADAEPCPNCGFKFYVLGSIQLAYENVGGALICRVCGGNPEFAV